MGGRPLSFCTGPRPLSTHAGTPSTGPSPVLCLQPVARAVGLLQVALQLLLPLPVGGLLMAQTLVLQLKPQECLPADQEEVEQGWGPVSPHTCPGSELGTGQRELGKEQSPGEDPSQNPCRTRKLRAEPRCGGWSMGVGGTEVRGAISQPKGGARQGWGYMSGFKH